MTTVSAADVEAAAFTADAAAVYTGLSVNALGIRRSRGLGPRYLRRGARILYLKTDLDAWLSAAEDA
jgi:hypothetical protein